MSDVRHRCGQCERIDEECGPVSKRGLCIDCAQANQVAAMRQMHAKQGPIYERWKGKQAAAAARLVEAYRKSGEIDLP